MKKTLLEMVQSIMSSMDADTVNSISDTEEAMQVANYLRDSYYEIVSGLNLPNTFSLFQLIPSIDPTLPTVMYLPSNVLNVHWIKYNKVQLLTNTADNVESPGFYSLANGNSSYNYDIPDTSIVQGDGTLGSPNFLDVCYIDLEHFLQRMYQTGNGEDSSAIVDTGSGTLTTPNGNQLSIFWRKDRSPQHWTTFDDHTILFDSYDAEVENTLQNIKTVCWGEMASQWVMEDTFIPRLNDMQFTLLENEAKQQAFVEAKQSSNPVATQRAHKGWVRARRNKHQVPYSANSRAKTTTWSWGRTANPLANAQTYHSYEEN